MERFEACNLQVSLYDESTTVRDVAVDKTKTNTDPARLDVEDPFFIYDLGDVIAKDNIWRQLLPSVDTFYAVKCNPDPVMVRLLVGLGRSFDCASRKEIQLVLDSGASPDRIIFAHPCKQESHIRFAKENGVRFMTFDHEEELCKVKRVHPEARLLLRVVYEEPGTAVWKYGKKFGCRETDVVPLMKLAEKLGLDVVGISFHVGSEVTNPSVFDGAIRHVRPMFDIGRTLGFDMTVLDIGGGYPGRENPKTSFDQFACTINAALAEMFPPSSGVRVIAEPGTFYALSAGHLVANVTSKHECKRHRHEEDPVDQNSNEVSNEGVSVMYYLNVGVFNSLIYNLVDPDYTEPPEPIKTNDKVRKLRSTCLWGPTCDSVDVIFERRMMVDVDGGDFVMFRDVGGYHAPCASGFNGYGAPPTCYIAPRHTLPILEKIFNTVKRSPTTTSIRRV